MRRDIGTRISLKAWPEAVAIHWTADYGRSFWPPYIASGAHALNSNTWYWKLA